MERPFLRPLIHEGETVLIHGREELELKKPEMNTMRLKLLREILGAKTRFVAITLVVTIGVMIFIASSMSYRNLQTSYEQTYKELRFADFTIKAEKIPPYIVDRVSKVPGVTMVTPRVRKDVSFTMPGGKKIVGRVYGLPYQRPIVDDLLMKKGNYFAKGDRQVAIAESHFTQFYNIKPGAVLEYNNQGVSVPVKVVGVASNPEYIVLAGEKGDFSPMMSASTMAVLWMPMADAQSMAQLPGQYNQLLLLTDPARNQDKIIAQVEDIMKYTGIQEVVSKANHQGNKMLQMDIQGLKSFALFFPLLFLGIACFSIYILLSRLVYTQRPFIGVMRAMGYSRKQILSHYLSFAMIIGVLGGLAGLILGYALSAAITSIYASTIGIPIVKIATYWSVLFEGLVLSLAFCAFAGLLPAARSARLDPSKAMRGDTLEQIFRPPLMEKIFPPFKKLPLFLKVPIRNMYRNRRRTVFTVLGLIFSVMIVLVFLGVLNTSNDALNRGFKLNNKFSMVAIFLGGRDLALLNKIQRIDGVTAVEGATGYNCKVAWGDTSTDTVFMGLSPATNMKMFFTADKKQVYITDGHVLMNRWFQSKEHLKTGDMVTISTSLDREKKFTIGAFIDEPMGNIIYIPRSDAQDLLAHGTVSRGSFYVKVKPGSEVQVTRQLEKLPGMASIIDLKEIKREVDHYMNLMYIIVYVMLVFALLMAFTLTFNTITINILEREREIATMRTIGTESWKISAMTTLENVIFGLLAIVPGILLGIAVGRYALSLQQTEYFQLSLVVFGSSYVLVSAGIILILLICQVPSLRYVKSVDLATATKERGA
jgi:putative ABC transport system permease protein